VNKHEFIESLAEECELSKAEAGRTLDAILDSLTDVMVDREEISFTGFGKFMTQRRRAREGVDPRDPSKKIKIRAAYVPKFRPGATLREAVAQTSAQQPAKQSPSQSRAGADSDGGNESRPASAAAERAATAEETAAGWAPLGERS